MKRKFKIIHLVLLLLIVPKNILALNKNAPFIGAFNFIQSQKDSINQKFYEIDSLYKKEKFTIALEKAFNYLVSLEDNEYYSKYYLNRSIGNIYSRTSNMEEALSFHYKALRDIELKSQIESKSLNIKFDIAETYLEIGRNYQKLSLQDSINNKFNLSKAALKDSAKVYYRKIENFPSINDDILSIKAKAYSNLSGIFEVDTIYDLAKEYANKAIKIYQKTNNKIDEAGARNNLGNIYFSEGKFEKSKEIYSEAINLIRNFNSNRAIQNKAFLYSNLAWAMRKLKEYKAYDYLEESHVFYDKIRLREEKRTINELTAIYDVTKARKEEQIKRKLQAQQFWISIAVGILVIISLILYILFYRQRRKTLALRLANIDYEQKQKIDALKSESRNRVLSATLDGKEEERKVIAETLHDNVSALLSSANLHLQAMAKQLNGNTPAELNKTKNILNEASDKIRDLSHSLVSPVLQKFGLKLSISEIADKFSNSELEIETNIEGLTRYESNFEVKTYNIIHEFCNNIIKHSKATKAKIYIQDEEGFLNVLISDNGIGFDKDLVNTKDGLGIAHIEARVELMNGEINIESQKSVGTTIKIKLPIQEKEKIELAFS